MAVAEEVLTREFLEHQHHVLKKTLTDIGKETGFGRHVTAKYLKIHGIEKWTKPGMVKNDLTGKKFTNWTVKDYSGRDKSGNHTWKCECVCGAVGVKTSSSLTSGGSQSCGCIQKGKKYQSSYVGEMSGRVWGRVLSHGVARGIIVEITKEYAWNLFLQQNRKCAISGVDLFFPITTKETDAKLGNASLDRIDSSIGYIEGNVQWVHKTVNFMKNVLTNTEFNKWIETIYIHQKESTKWVYHI